MDTVEDSSIHGSVRGTSRWVVAAAAVEQAQAVGDMNASMMPVPIGWRVEEVVELKHKDLGRRMHSDHKIEHTDQGNGSAAEARDSSEGIIWVSGSGSAL